MIRAQLENHMARASEANLKWCISRKLYPERPEAFQGRELRVIGFADEISGGRNFIKRQPATTRDVSDPARSRSATAQENAGIAARVDIDLSVLCSMKKRKLAAGLL